jgi:hypothetical protein
MFGRLVLGFRLALLGMLLFALVGFLFPFGFVLVLFRGFALMRLGSVGTMGFGTG